MNPVHTRTKAFCYAIKALVTHKGSQTCSSEQLHTLIPTTFGQLPPTDTSLTHIFQTLRFYVKK